MIMGSKLVSTSTLLGELRKRAWKQSAIINPSGTGTISMDKMKLT